MQLAVSARSGLPLLYASYFSRRRLLAALTLLSAGIRGQVEPMAERGTSPSSERAHAQTSILMPPMTQPVLRLVLLGDVMVGRIVNESLSCDHHRWHDCWGSALAKVKAFDSRTTIIGGNLECASKYVCIIRFVAKQAKGQSACRSMHILTDVRLPLGPIMQ